MKKNLLEIKLGAGITGGAGGRDFSCEHSPEFYGKGFQALLHRADNGNDHDQQKHELYDRLSGLIYEKGAEVFHLFHFNALGTRLTTRPRVEIIE